jgi:hypothetical protein
LNTDFIFSRISPGNFRIKNALIGTTLTSVFNWLGALPAHRQGGAGSLPPAPPARLCVCARAVDFQGRPAVMLEPARAPTFAVGFVRLVFDVVAPDVRGRLRAAGLRRGRAPMFEAGGSAASPSRRRVSLPGAASHTPRSARPGDENNLP